jgi:phosphoglycerate kinase
VKKQTVRDIDLTGKLVFDRVDYNVPIDGGVVGDTLRIQGSFETIRYLLERNCRIVLASHLGRPDGKPDPKYSLEPVAKKAAELLKHPVAFAPDCIGHEVADRVKALKSGEIMLLENLRFHPEEEANDDDFAKELASFGEVFVEDAFAVIHRAHASTAGITKYLPAVSGLLVEREVDTITTALENPKRPLIAVIGGAKISDKIEVVSNLLTKVDALLIGGAMANTFLAADGHEIGKSLYEKDQIALAHRIVKQAEERGIKLFLPIDVVVTDDITGKGSHRTVPVVGVKPGEAIVDIGPKSIEKATTAIAQAGTIIWNGPLGITEVPAFAAGSRLLAEKIIHTKAQSIIGGGDTAAFVDAAGLHDRFGFVSTGGGASLELMSGKPLPGIEALLDKS